MLFCKMIKPLPKYWKIVLSAMLIVLLFVVARVDWNDLVLEYFPPKTARSTVQHPPAINQTQTKQEIQETKGDYSPIISSNEGTITINNSTPSREGEKEK